jgi:hypothetical protein
MQIHGVRRPPILRVSAGKTALLGLGDGLGPQENGKNPPSKGIFRRFSRVWAVFRIAIFAKQTLIIGST